MAAYSAPGFLAQDGRTAGFPWRRTIEDRVAAFPATRRSQSSSTIGLVYRDPAMLTVVQRAQRIARSDASVLVRGESGTGKEVIARYIHRNSPRAERPVRRGQLRGDSRAIA